MTSKIFEDLKGLSFEELVQFQNELNSLVYEKYQEFKNNKPVKGDSDNIDIKSDSVEIDEDNQYYQNLLKIKDNLETLEIKVSDVRYDMEKESFVIYAAGFKICSSRFINKHDDYSWSIMISKNKVIRVFSDVKSSVEYIMQH